jgi:hypothetical protein
MDGLLSDQSVVSGCGNSTPDGVPLEGQAGGALGRVGSFLGGPLSCSGSSSLRTEINGGGSIVAPTETVANIARRPESSERSAVAVR